MHGVSVASNSENSVTITDLEKNSASAFDFIRYKEPLEMFAKKAMSPAKILLKNIIEMLGLNEGFAGAIADALFDPIAEFAIKETGAITKLVIENKGDAAKNEISSIKIKTLNLLKSNNGIIPAILKVKSRISDYNSRAINLLARAGKNYLELTTKIKEKKEVEDENERKKQLEAKKRNMKADIANRKRDAAIENFEEAWTKISQGLNKEFCDDLKSRIFNQFFSTHLSKEFQLALLKNTLMKLVIPIKINKSE